MLRYIQAQSMSLKDIERYVKHHITEIQINFIMLILGEKVLTRNHWMHEVYAQLHDVPTAGNSKDFPHQKKLFKWLYTDNIADYTNPKKFNKLLKAIGEKEKELPKPTDKEWLKQRTLELLEEYYVWLSTELSDSGYVTAEEVRDCLKSIFNEV